MARSIKHVSWSTKTSFNASQIELDSAVLGRLGPSSTFLVDQAQSFSTKFLGLPSVPSSVDRALCRKSIFCVCDSSFRSVSFYLDRQEPHSTESSFSQPKRVDANTRYSHQSRVYRCQHRRMAWPMTLWLGD